MPQSAPKLRLFRSSCASWSTAALAMAICLLPGEAALAEGKSRGHHTGKHSQAASPTRPADEAFQKVTLNAAPGEPIGLAVLPDGRVLHTTRGGIVWMHDPVAGFNTVAAEIPVYSHDEEGLQGIAIDPGFERNHWVYIYYSPVLDTPLDDPRTPTINEGDAPPFPTPQQLAAFRGHMQLSRFRLRGARLDLESEQQILQVPTDRGICCHVGGDIDFDSEGNLYLSTGDDTNPFESSGYAPLDIRPGRHPAFDAQRTSGNTNDLRGKLLRIRVRRDGSYGIPRGNLSAFLPRRLRGRVRPEIYAMGLRNPFRFAVDRRSSAVYVADYSPDATEPSPELGPAGQGKWMVVAEPANYGWPFCATAELPYASVDFATGQAGNLFDCEAPRNQSPNNTGLVQLPAVTQPEIWYGSLLSEQFPELGENGVAPMAGPAYAFDAGLASARKWPRYFDGRPLFYEWTRDYIKELSLTRRGEVAGIVDLMPQEVFENPIDMEFGPDGALYVLEYGEGYFGENPEARLARVDYAPESRSPVAVATADREFGLVPLTVQLSATGSSDPDGDAITFEWDFDADGVVDSTDPSPTTTFSTVGKKAPAVRVVDATGRSSTAAVVIVAGNLPPAIEFVTPQPGQLAIFGEPISYEVRVTDDQPVDCDRVEVQYILGHDQHGHPLSTARGCSGQFDTTLDEAHVGAEDIAAVLVATYEDAPAEPGVPPLSAQGFVVLPPAPAP